MEFSGNKVENRMLNRLYVDKYIFNIYPDLIQVLKIVGERRYWIMDLWAYDFYKNEYHIEEHKKWVEQINERVEKMDSNREKMLFVRNERKKNTMISSEMTEHFSRG